MTGTTAAARADAPSKAKPGAMARDAGSLIHVGSARDVTQHTPPNGSADPPIHVAYQRSTGVDDFVARLCAADPIRLIETERKGVAGVFVKDLAGRMQIPAQRMFAILGVPKATVEKKVAVGDVLTGNGGRAAIGLARLLGQAQAIVEHSTAPEAVDFDAARWLGQWLEKPQPALGGRKPAELIDTPTGLAVVARLLGAIESGAYQ